MSSQWKSSKPTTWGLSKTICCQVLPLTTGARSSTWVTCRALMSRWQISTSWEAASSWSLKTQSITMKTTSNSKNRGISTQTVKGPRRLILVTKWMCCFKTSLWSKILIRISSPQILICNQIWLTVQIRKRARWSTILKIVYWHIILIRSMLMSNRGLRGTRLCCCRKWIMKNNHLKRIQKIINKKGLLYNNKNKRQKITPSN